jgi:hypothetical protein
MSKSISLNTNVCPLFNPSTYYSTPHIDEDEIIENYCLSNNIDFSLYSDNLNNFFKVNDTFSFKDFFEDLIKSDLLSELEYEIKYHFNTDIKISMYDYFVPKSYNYLSDTIDFEIQGDIDLIKSKIINWLITNPMIESDLNLKEYLLENYKSYSGFNSYTEYKLDSFIE